MDYEFKPKYYNADEFKTYTGIDLSLELGDDDNPSNKVNSFLARVENRVKVYLASHFNSDVDRFYELMSDYQKLHFKYALIEQALYIIKNGDISVLSGVQNGRVSLSRNEQQRVIICENAVNELRLCNLWNRNVSKQAFRGRYWWY